MTNNQPIIEKERNISSRKCNIDEFRIAVAEAASALQIKMEDFKLKVEISGGIDTPDIYELEVYNGQNWISLKRDQNLCVIIDVIMDAVNMIFKKGKVNK